MLQPLRFSAAVPEKFPASATLTVAVTLTQTHWGPVQGLLPWVWVCCCVAFTQPTVRALITTGVLISTLEKSCCGDWLIMTSKAAVLPAWEPATGGLLTRTQGVPTRGR